MCRGWRSILLCRSNCPGQGACRSSCNIYCMPKELQRYRRMKASSYVRANWYNRNRPVFRPSRSVRWLRMIRRRNRHDVTVKRNHVLTEAYDTGIARHESVPSAFGFPPPKANHPVPSLSMTTPGSKGVLQRPSPGVLPEMRFLPSVVWS